jgi:hypothetical protein
MSYVTFLEDTVAELQRRLQRMRETMEQAPDVALSFDHAPPPRIELFKTAQIEASKGPIGQIKAVVSYRRDDSYFNRAFYVPNPATLSPADTRYLVVDLHQRFMQQMLRDRDETP